MSREEYLATLNQELSFLKEENRRAALAFYAEMLDDRMEDGMDEESAVNAMEAPADIAARLRTDNGEDQASPLHHPMRDEMLEFSALADSALRGVERFTTGKPEIAPTADEMVRRAKEGTRWTEQTEQAKQEPRPAEDADEKAAPEPAPAAPQDAPRAEDGQQQEGLSSLIGSVIKGAQKILESVPGLVEESTQAAGNAAQEAAEKARKTSESAAAGAYEKKEFACRAEDVRAVRLAAADMPIAVRPGEGDEIRLVYYRSDREPYEARLENGVLSLENEALGRKNRGFSFSFFTTGLKVLWTQPTPTVELFLPADALVDLKAHTSNGSVRLEGLKALCAVDLKTSNSRISIQDTVCKSLEAKTSNSRLVLERLVCKQAIQAKTSNARIEAASVRAGGEMHLSTSNGRMAVTDIQAPMLVATTSNSGIQVSGLNTRSILLRTSNGSIRGTVPGKQADWAIDSGLSNGKNSLPRQQAGLYPLSVHTSNGSIDIQFEG